MNHDWINSNYTNIIQWSKNITKNDELAEELAHYSIEVFLTHKRYDEIMTRDERDPDHGHARAFILSIMRNSWYGHKSEFTRYHKAHRADIGKRKRVISDEAFSNILENTGSEYDYELDYIIEAILGIIEEMSIDTKKLWYNAKLFEMYIQNPNYSALSRETGIPRTSISTAITEAKEYIINELNNRGILYE